MLAKDTIQKARCLSPEQWEERVSDSLSVLNDRILEEDTRQ